jgi:predicted DNA binding CopG/RHH family protein
MKKHALKTMPSLKSDEEAEQFVESADLSEYDLSGFAPVQFEFEPKTAALNMRLPQNLLAAVKIRAQAEGMPYTRYIRFLLEQAVTRP